MYKAKYFLNSNLWQASEKPNHSWIWKQILRQRETFKEAVAITRGNGQNTNLWEDIWIPNKILKDYVNHDYDVTSTVADIMLEGKWNLELLRTLVPTEIVHEIMVMTIPINQEQDMLVWSPNPLGKFTIKSAYNFIIQKNQKLETHWP